VALKQCLALPKPLWHEVMELLGGEAEMLSRFELVQRTDLDSDEDDTDGEAAKAAGSGSEEKARTKAARRAAVEVQNKEKETTKRLTWLEAATRGRDGREKREEERGGVLSGKQKSARKSWFRTMLNHDFGEVQYQHHAYSKSGLELNRQPGDSKTKQQISGLVAKFLKAPAASADPADSRAGLRFR